MAEVKVNNILTDKVDEENINDVINNANVVDEDIAKAAAEQIAKRRKEQVTQELIEVTQKCEFAVLRTVLSVRRSNKVNKRTKAYLKDLAALKDEIVNGKKPVSDWNTKSCELKRAYDKEISDIDKEIDESITKLNDIFPNSWSWRYSSLIPSNHR